MLLILSHLAEAGHSGPILPFFKSKTKKHSCCAAVSSLSCVTGLEPGKNDAKGQNRQSMFSCIFFFQVAEGYSHEDKCDRLELQVLLHTQTLGVEELLNSCQPVFK